MKVLAAGLDDTTFAFLRSAGIIVEEQDVEDVEDLESWLQGGIYDAGIIQLERSGLGIYAARGLRAKKIATPLIGISRGSESRAWGEHRALFLENGGDDLLRSPVNPRELVASLRAITRRPTGMLLDVAEYQNAGAKLKINLTARSVLVNDRVLPLTNKEMTLLLLLASHPGRVVSKEMALSQMYTDGIDEEPETKTIDVFVCKLRAKLTKVHPDAVAFVKTVWGHGYRMPEQSELKQETEAAA